MKDELAMLESRIRKYELAIEDEEEGTGFPAGRKRFLEKELMNLQMKRERMINDMKLEMVGMLKD